MIKQLNWLEHMESRAEFSIIQDIGKEAEKAKAYMVPRTDKRRRGIDKTRIKYVKQSRHNKKVRCQQYKMPLENRKLTSMQV